VLYISCKSCHQSLTRIVQLMVNGPSGNGKELFVKKGDGIFPWLSCLPIQCSVYSMTDKIGGQATEWSFHNDFRASKCETLSPTKS
jgi:hypothetical protein